MQRSEEDQSQAMVVMGTHEGCLVRVVCVVTGGYCLGCMLVLSQNSLPNRTHSGETNLHWVVRVPPSLPPSLPPPPGCFSLPGGSPVCHA